MIAYSFVLIRVHHTAASARVHPEDTMPLLPGVVPIAGEIQAVRVSDCSVSYLNSSCLSTDMAGAVTVIESLLLTAGGSQHDSSSSDHDGSSAVGSDSVTQSSSTSEDTEPVAEFGMHSRPLASPVPAAKRRGSLGPAKRRSLVRGPSGPIRNAGMRPNTADSFEEDNKQFILPLGSEHGEDDEHTVTSATSQETALTELRKSMERCVCVCVVCTITLTFKLLELSLM